MKRSLICILIVLIACAGCTAIEPADMTDTPAPSQASQAPTEAATQPSPAATATTPEATATLTPEASASLTPEATVTLTPEVTVTLAPGATAAPTEAPAATPAVGEKLLQYNNDDIDVDIRCPEISGMKDGSLQTKVNAGIFEDLKKMADDLGKSAAEDTAKPEKYYIQTGFSVNRNDGLFLSVSVDIDYYAGGAHTNTDMRFINLENTNPGRQLKLGDVFSKGSDYISTVNKEINGIIAADSNMTSEITFTTVEPDQWFCLTGKELVIVFPSYSIAAGAYGIPEFRIPFKNLSGALIAELK
jgi:hypothetical protein